MRFAMISALALAAAAAAGPAAAQEFRLIPHGPASGDGQEYILLMIPGDRTSEHGDRTSLMDGRSSSERQAGSQMSSRSRSPTEASDSESRGSARDYARRIYRKGYEDGRRTASADNLSESDLRQFGRRYFARGYTRGRLDERAGDTGQPGGLNDDELSQLREAIRQARQAMWSEDYREARRAMRRAEILLPETPAADPDGPRSRSDMVPGGQPERNFLPSVRRPSVRQDNDQAQDRDSAQARSESLRSDRNQTGSTSQPEIADRAPPGTITGELPIDIPQSDGRRQTQDRNR